MATATAAVVAAHWLAARGTLPTHAAWSARSGSAWRDELANPGSDTRLAPGQMLVVMGSQKQLDRFTRLLGTALKSVDVMST